MTELIKLNKSTYQEFWKWFETKEKDFFNVVKERQNIDGNFLDIILPQLKELNENFFILVGMSDDSKAELIITVDGNLKEIVYAEELIAESPKLENWKFTALKPELEIDKISLKMGDYIFNKENIYFYSNDDEDYPDEIDLVFVHEDFNDQNESDVINGTYLFIDSYLGELNFLAQIDNFRIAGKSEAEKELIPIEKLKDFLSWREREFTEKYEDAKIETSEDSYSLLEGTLESGFPLLATVNVDLLQWDQKASHPWISVLRIEYQGDEDNGFPDDKDYDLFNLIEDEMMLELKNDEGNLNLGRETAENIREIYFVSRDFRKISKVLAETVQKYPDYRMTFEIYKDKYWQSFERYGIH
ncbi:DUF695 domain-containing protein [Kaistella flava (ex Peng et al. 2021)]|uniref:DUF695 domain-containing protein n=1 Tax=Kaistella flava (ex Peng et al. 2021) TaxID=2038776 RepID=A0A7M2YCJ7_9FLAO|nr:DUF695 domain-containing protein [Kaistella flava (ex Peng et al. 2021)]QOW11539.1 DUF695 domain-containing protein [Kaistella flava (ex Peng et al. 2021)]